MRIAEFIIFFFPNQDLINKSRDYSYFIWIKNWINYWEFTIDNLFWLFANLFRNAEEQ
jgi:hypothetical protein